jgi:hypothetical protein
MKYFLYIKSNSVKRFWVWQCLAFSTMPVKENDCFPLLVMIGPADKI